MKILLPLMAVALACACHRDEEIVRVRAPKEDAPGASSFEAPMPEPGDRPSGLRWTLPAGWKELPGTGMRLATLLPPGGAKLEGTVVALPGDVGGELPNVNRWRGQIGLPPVTEAGMEASRRRLESPAGPVTLYDFTGAGTQKTRLLAAIVKTPGTTWFLKLMGDAEGVGAARAGFVSLLGGLRAAP